MLLKVLLIDDFYKNYLAKLSLGRIKRYRGDLLFLIIYLIVKRINFFYDLSG